MQKVFLLLFSLITFIPCFSQEEFGYNLLNEKDISVFKPPTEPKQIYLSKYWFGLPNHEPDLVNKNAYYPKNIERYYYFENYLGLQLYNPKKRNGRTFATTKLKHPIKKGKTYKLYIGGFFPYNINFIENYVRKDLELRTESQFQQNLRLVQNGISQFSKIPFGFSYTKTRPETLNDLQANAQTEIISTRDFFKFYTEFTAKEDAEYITIGNFLQNKEIPKEILYDIQKYVLIFEVSLTESKLENLIPNGDFEDHTRPDGLGQWWRLNDWFNPHPNREHNRDDPSPDLITIFSRDVKYPIRGEGSGRVGYINREQDIFNEGLAVKLKSPLKKGKKYVIAFNIGSTNKTTNQFIKRINTSTDLDSLKVQFGFSHNRPEQGNGKFLEAQQLLEYSQYLSYLFTNKVVQIDFIANEDYEYFAFGYFEELDVPALSRVGVMMDDLYLYEIPEETLVPEINTALVNAETPPDLIAKQTDKTIAKVDKIPIPKENEKPNASSSNPTETKNPENPVVVSNPKEEEIKSPPTPKITEFYDEADSTKVRIKHEYEVKKSLCKLKVYDHGTEDGDIVTLKLNDTEIVKHLKIRRKPNIAEFDVELKEGENYIYPIAENLGRIPPNTIQIIVDCQQQNVEEQSYRLFSRPGSSEALRLIFGTENQQE